METGLTQPPSVAIVIPAFDAAGFLRATLPATIRAAGEAPVLVVDDGSADDTAAVAEELGARVLRRESRRGPAAARNAGVADVGADVVLFLDADCAPHPDAIDRVRRAFEEDPDLVALTGSYDADPPERGFFSDYMNLRHHFFHQRARRSPATFWAGCGAVRREAFLRLGGFDAERYPRPQIEDIELGFRLRGIGSTRLDPDLQVTHLKRWSLRSVVETDVLHRAVPWARLLLAHAELPDDLNLAWSQRIAAVVAPFALAAPAVLVWALATGAGALAALSATALGVSLGLHAAFLREFSRRRGPAFAAGAWLFHQVHLTYSAATLAVVAALHAVRRRV